MLSEFADEGTGGNSAPAAAPAKKSSTSWADMTDEPTKPAWGGTKNYNPAGWPVLMFGCNFFSGVWCVEAVCLMLLLTRYPKLFPLSLVFFRLSCAPPSSCFASCSFLVVNFKL